MSEASPEKRAQALLKYKAVCLCNSIRYPAVKLAIDRGARTVDEVARATGCTTETCQGERCTPVVEALLQEGTKGP